MTAITIDKELLEQVVNKLLTCWPKSDPLVNELRAALAAPATAPEPVAWLAHYVGRSGMEQEYVSTDKTLADENDASGKAQPLYLHPPATAPAWHDAQQAEIESLRWTVKDALESLDNGMTADCRATLSSATKETP